MSKERLEVIIQEGLLESLEQHLNKNEAGHVRIIEDVAWLIEQAKRVQELEVYVEENSKKAAKLNVFLQERDTTSTLGMHVIDAVMKYVQELEESKNRHRESLEVIFNGSLEFSGYEDLDVHNPELFHFASAVNNESQQALEDES